MREKRGLLAGAMTLAGGSMIGQLLGVAALPLISRLFTPRDLGRYGLVLSFINLAAVAACLRYEVAILTPKKFAEAVRIASGAVLISVPMALLSGLLLWWLIGNAYLGYGELPLVIVPVVGATIVCLAVFAALRGLALRRQRFRQVQRVTVYQNGARALTQVVLGLLQAGWLGLVFGEVAGRVSGIGALAKQSGKYVWATLRGANWQPILQSLKDHRKFPLFSLPSSIIDTSAVTLMLPLLTELYGSSAAGQVALTQRALALPSVLIGLSFADAFHTKLSECVHKDPAQVRRLFDHTGRVIASLSIGPVVVLLIAGPWLFSFVFGREWAVAGYIGRAMALGLLAQLIVSPLSRAVLVLSGQEFKLVYDGLILSGILGVFMVARRLTLPLISTVWLLTGTRVIAYAAYYVILRRLVARIEREPVLVR